ncbi:hypothetical protein [Spiroplasma endosymbiont of Aleiodes alternator]
MNTFLKVFLTQRLQFCVYFILDVHNLIKIIVLWDFPAICVT